MTATQRKAILWLALAGVLALGISGCGDGDPVDVDEFPLPPGASVAANAEVPGVAEGSVYRALLVVAPDLPGSEALIRDEGDTLKDQGWTVGPYRYDLPEGSRTAPHHLEAVSSDEDVRAVFATAEQARRVVVPDEWADRLRDLKEADTPALVAHLITPK